MKKIFLFLSFAILFIACSPTPQPIDYGHEECAFCKMTIVSQQFAAEVVTNKSKAFKYDAIECMIQAQQEDAALHLTCDYLNPDGNLIDATKATYLVSKQIESPMGANLAAFSSLEDAKKVQEEKGGDLYDWEAIQKRFHSGHTPVNTNNMHDH
ncbi:MAG: nitrous oxide reductase accessory protein NosL [Capnocytophaga sp.]|nr:nitrous oxide reductase accessory protein NosL [Capnocytophaga sp.]